MAILPVRASQGLPQPDVVAADDSPDTASAVQGEAIDEMPKPKKQQEQPPAPAPAPAAPVNESFQALKPYVQSDGSVVHVRGRDESDYLADAASQGARPASLWDVNGSQTYVTHEDEPSFLSQNKDAERLHMVEDNGQQVAVRESDARDYIANRRATQPAANDPFKSKLDLQYKQQQAASDIQEEERAQREAQKTYGQGKADALTILADPIRSTFNAFAAGGAKDIIDTLETVGALPAGTSHGFQMGRIEQGLTTKLTPGTTGKVLDFIGEGAGGLGKMMVPGFGQADLVMGGVSQANDLYRTLIAQGKSPTEAEEWALGSFGVYAATMGLGMKFGMGQKATQDLQTAAAEAFKKMGRAERAQAGLVIANALAKQMAPWVASSAAEGAGQAEIQKLSGANPDANVLQSAAEGALQGIGAVIPIGARLVGKSVGMDRDIRKILADESRPLSTPPPSPAKLNTLMPDTAPVEGRLNEIQRKYGISPDDLSHRILKDHIEPRLTPNDKQAVDDMRARGNPDTMILSTVLHRAAQARPENTPDIGKEQIPSGGNPDATAIPRGSEPPAPRAPYTVGENAPEGIDQSLWEVAEDGAKRGIAAMVNKGVDPVTANRTLRRWTQAAVRGEQDPQQEAEAAHASMTPQATTEPDAGHPAPEQQAKELMTSSAADGVIENHDPASPAFDASALARSVIDQAIAEAEKGVGHSEDATPATSKLPEYDRPEIPLEVKTDDGRVALNIAGETQAELTRTEIASRTEAFNRKHGVKTISQAKPGEQLYDVNDPSRVVTVVSPKGGKYLEGNENKVAGFDTARWLPMPSQAEPATDSGNVTSADSMTSREVIGSNDSQNGNKATGTAVDTAIAEESSKKARMPKAAKTKPVAQATEPEQASEKSDEITELSPRHAEENAQVDELARSWGFTNKQRNDSGWAHYPLSNHETLDAPPPIKGHVSDNHITVAQGPNGKWTYGMHASIGNSDHGFGADIHGQQFETKQEAIVAAAKDLYGDLKKLSSDHMESPAIAKRMSTLEAWINKIAPGTVPPPQATDKTTEAPSHAPAPAKKARMPKKASAAKAETYKPVGENADGLQVEQDARGVRSFVRDGMRLHQPIALSRLSSGMESAAKDSAEALYSSGRKEFLTKEEIAKFDAEKAAREAPKVAPPEAPALRDEDIDAFFDKKAAEKKPAARPTLEVMTERLGQLDSIEEKKAHAGLAEAVEAYKSGDASKLKDMPPMEETLKAIELHYENASKRNAETQAKLENLAMLVGRPVGEVKEAYRLALERGGPEHAEKVLDSTIRLNQPREAEYNGVSTTKPAKDLTDAELDVITAPSPILMKDRNVQLAHYQSDPRFDAPVPGRPGVVHTDFRAVRDFLRDGTLSDHGQKIDAIAKELWKMNPAFNLPNYKTAGHILRAIETGRYNDMLHPDNKASRAVFTNLTNVKLPAGVALTKQAFRGRPFTYTLNGETVTAPEPEKQALPERASTVVSPETAPVALEQMPKRVVSVNGTQVLKEPEAVASPTPAAMPAPASAAAPAASGLKIVDQMHTKRGHMVSIVTMPERVPSDTYAKMAASARSLGGKYQTGYKPTKTPAGFMFNSRKSADEFAAKWGGPEQEEKVPAGWTKPSELNLEVGSGQPQQIPGMAEGLTVNTYSNAYRGAEYPYRVVISRQSDDFGFLTVSGNGKTTQQAYASAAWSFEENLAKRTTPEQVKAQDAAAKEVQKPVVSSTIEDDANAIKAILAKAKSGVQFAPEKPLRMPRRATQAVQFAPESSPSSAADAIYQQVKPHMVSAWGKITAGGGGVPEFLQKMYDLLGDEGRPYLKRFAAELRSGSIELSNQPKPATIEASGGGQRNELERQGEAVGNAGVGPGGSTAGAEPSRWESRAGSRVESQGGTEVVSSGSAGLRDGRGVAGRDAVEQGASGSGNADQAGGEQRDSGSNGQLGSSEPRIAKAPANAGSYTITDFDAFEAGGARTKFAQNIAAIRLMKDLVAEQRPATPSEQDVLAKYCGWGRSEFSEGLFAYYGSTADAWRVQRDELRSLLTDDEWESARSSTTNAHYTTPRLAASMWRMAQRLGFKGGRVEEPAIGTGIFYSVMPGGIRGKSSLHASEMDTLTANIARLLHPNAVIENKPYQEVSVPDAFFDLVISNVPFESTTIREDKYNKIGANLHNYFFLKGIETTRPGGLYIAITSTGTMDSQGTRAREVLADKADLVAAMRFPEGAFLKNAGTAVVTDVLLLRRRMPGEPSNGIAWKDLATMPDPDGGEAIPINEYFAAHPENILGTLDRKSRQYGKGQPHVSMTDDFMDRLERAIEALPKDVYKSSSYKAPSRREMIEANSGLKQFAHEIRDGKVWQRQDAELVEKPMSKEKVAQVGRLMALRDTRHEIIAAELNGDETKQLRARLNQQYDAYVAKHGILHSAEVRKLVGDDPDFPNILALEDYDQDTKEAKKSDIFTKPTVRRDEKPTKAETVEQAAGISMNENASIDVDRVAELLGVPVEQATNMLTEKGIAFKLPNGGVEIADYYLSGNVKEKLLQAQRAAVIDKSFQPNVDALLKVQPADKLHTEIDVKLGSIWIPAEDYSEFCAHLFKTSPSLFQVQWMPKTGEWVTSFSDGLKGSAAWTEAYGTPDAGFDKILNAALSDRTIKIMTTDPQGNKVYLPDQSAAANMQVEALRERFMEWIWSDDERRLRLSRYYNDNFNNIVPTKFDGKWINFPTLAAGWVPYPHQANAVARVLHTRRMMLAHEVGTGKTLTYGLCAAKARELGFANKPCLVVLKANIEQVTDEIQRAFPTMRILSTNEQFDQQNRRKTIARIATGDWDLVIMTHDNFNMMDVDKDVEKAFIEQEIKELSDVIASKSADDSSSSRYGRRRSKSTGDKAKERTVKQLEKMRHNLNEKLKDALSRPRDEAVSFQRIGIDMLMVDEAHAYKSLPVYTTRENTKGIPNSRSDRATNMLLNTRWLRTNNDKAVIIFGTGTPIDNSMVELYNWQKYLQPEELAARSIETFDGWANTFGQTVTEVEPTAAGDFKPTTRFKRFTNIGELWNISQQVMDVQFIEDLKNPDGTPIINRPHRVDTVDTAEPSAKQIAFMAQIAARAKALKGKKVEKGADNMLAICTDGRKASIVNPDGTIPANGKVARCIKNVLANHKKDQKLTQMIFLDMGVNEIFGTSVYKHIIDKLVAGGIPRSKIIDFAKLPDGDKRLEAIARLRSGEALVGIGSTSKMGTGVNAQTYLRWMHNVDAPMTPGKLEQRIGRGWRQKNTNAEVGVVEYVTGGTLDSFVWSLIHNKASFIKQYLRNGGKLREIEESDADTISPARVMAEATGNPDVLNSVELGEKVKKLEQKKRVFTQNAGRATAMADLRRKALASLQERLKGVEKDAEQVKKTEEEKGVTINGRHYEKYDDAMAKAFGAAVDSSGEYDQIANIRGFGIYRSKASNDLASRMSRLNNGGHSISWFIRGPSGHSYNMSPGDEGDNPELTIIRSAAGVIRNLPARVESTRAEIQRVESDIAEYEKASKQQFAQNEDLAQAKRDLQAIMARLSAASKNPSQNEMDVKIAAAEGQLADLIGQERVQALHDMAEKAGLSPEKHLERLVQEIEAIEKARHAQDEAADAPVPTAPITANYTTEKPLRLPQRSSSATIDPWREFRGPSNFAKGIYDEQDIADTFQRAVEKAQPVSSGAPVERSAAIASSAVERAKQAISAGGSETLAKSLRYAPEFGATASFRVAEKLAGRHGIEVIPVTGLPDGKAAMVVDGRIYLQPSGKLGSNIIHEIGHILDRRGDPSVRSLIASVDRTRHVYNNFAEQLSQDPVYRNQLQNNAEIAVDFENGYAALAEARQREIDSEIAMSLLEGNEDAIGAFKPGILSMRAAALRAVFSAMAPESAATDNSGKVNFASEETPASPSTGPPPGKRMMPKKLSEMTPKDLARERSERLRRGRMEATKDIREAAKAVKPAMDASRKQGIPPKASDIVKGLADEKNHRIRETAVTLEKVAKVVALGEKATAKDIKEIQTLLNGFIDRNMPREELKREEWRALAKAVAGTQSLKDLDNVLPKIIELADSSSRRILATEIRGLWNQIRNDSRMAVEAVQEVFNLLEQHIVGKRILVKGLTAKERAFANKVKMQSVVNKAMFGSTDNPLRELSEREKNIIQALARTPLTDKTAEELTELRDMIKSWQEMGRFVLKARRAVMRSKADQAAEEIAGELTPPKDYSLRRDANGLDWKDRAFNRWQKMREAWQWNLDNTSMMDSLFMEWAGSRDPSSAVMRLIKRPIDVGFSQHAVAISDVVSRTIQKVKELEIAPDRQEVIGIHAIMQQKNGEKKLLNSGYSATELASLSPLTKNEADFLAWMRAEMDAIFPDLQRIARDYYNTEVTKEDLYFPFVTDWDGVAGRTFKEMFADDGETLTKTHPGDETVGRSTQTSQGFTKSRVGAGRQPVQTNAIRVFLSHMNRALYYREMEPRLQDLNKITANEFFRGHMGADRMRILRDWMDTIARQGGVPNALRWRALEKLAATIGAAKLAFKPATAMVQTTPIILGFTYNGTWQMKAAAEVPGSYALRQWIYQNSPEVRFRMGNDPAYHDDVVRGIMKGIVTAGFYPLVKIDRLAASITWWGAYSKWMAQHGKTPDITKPADPDGAYYADVIMRRTNSSPHAKDMPQVISRGNLTYGGFRQKSIAKALFQFQGPLFAITDILRRDFIGRWYSEPVFAAFVLLVWILGNAWETALRRTIRSYMQPNTWENRYKYAGAAEKALRREMANLDVGDPRLWANLMMDFGQQTAGNIPGVTTLQGFSAGEQRIGVPVVDTVRDLAMGLSAAVAPGTDKAHEAGMRKAAKTAIGSFVPGGTFGLQAYEMMTGDRPFDGR